MEVVKNGVLETGLGLNVIAVQNPGRTFFFFGLILEQVFERIFLCPENFIGITLRVNFFR